MLKLPLLGAWNSVFSSPMTALLSTSRTRLRVRGDPGLWHYWGLLVLDAGFGFKKQIHQLVHVACSTPKKHRAFSPLTYDDSHEHRPGWQTGVLSLLCTLTTHLILGSLHLIRASSAPMWGFPTGCSSFGVLASIRGSAWVGPPHTCFLPAPQTEAKRTAWVREVLGPETLPSDDTALLIFSLVTFLCITWDTPRWAARNPLSPQSHLLQVENHQNGEFQHGVFILFLSLSLLWNVEVTGKRFLLSWHFCCFCLYFLILSRSLQDIQGSIYSCLLA